MGKDLNVLVRTGRGRIVVPVEEIEYEEIALNTTAVTIPDAEAIWVDQDDATDFLNQYADMRHLDLVYDAEGNIFGLYNPRHSTFRRVTFTDNGVNLLEFIELEFVIL